MKHRIRFALSRKWAGISVAVVALSLTLDQLSKALVISGMEIGEHIQLVPGFLRLTRTFNTGGAFSIFGEIPWLFYVLVPLAMSLLLFAVCFGFVRDPLGIVSCAMIFGGAAGNLIDRVFRGAVVDMIDVYCIRFAIFNVADCFITVGCILLFIYVLFFPEKENVA